MNFEKWIIFIVGIALGIFVSNYVEAQAVYGPQGQYLGYTQTSNGVTNAYTASGEFVGSTQTQATQTNYYSSQGSYQGSSAPIYTPTNTTINNIPSIPQIPTLGGW